MGRFFRKTADGCGFSHCSPKLSFTIILDAILVKSSSQQNETIMKINKLKEMIRSTSLWASVSVNFWTKLDEQV